MHKKPLSFYFSLLFLILTLRRGAIFKRVGDNEPREKNLNTISPRCLYFVLSSISQFFNCKGKKKFRLWWGKMLSRTFFFIICGNRSVYCSCFFFHQVANCVYNCHTHGNQTLIISKKYLTQLSLANNKYK